MIFTTYLANLKGKNLEDFGLKSPKIYYVMRNRGNDEVAPDDDWWIPFKKLSKVYPIKELWEQYTENYFTQIGLSKEARTWMKKVAEESLFHDVVLVCFEKDFIHCHRRLLANEIVRRHKESHYTGELLLTKGELR